MSAISSEATLKGEIVQDKSKIRSVLKPGILIAVLIGIALVYWLWFGFSQRSITTDDGISILAATGILEHGYPRMPSGFIYYRAVVPHYLLAGTIKIFGLNDLGVMLPGLVLALAGLWLVYLFAKETTGRPWIGVVAAGLLVVLHVETFYATSGRMYMALQFFTILASYSAWRGFVKGSTTFQWVTALAMLGAMLSHQQGGVILVAIPAAVVIIWWMKGDIRRLASVPYAIGILLILFGIYFFQLIIGLPQFFHELPPPRIDHSGLSLDFVVWAKHVFNLERAMPFGLWFLPLLGFLGYEALRKRDIQGNQGIVFMLLIFGVFCVANLLVIKTVGVRFWVMTFPIYTILICTSVAFFFSSFSKVRRVSHLQKLHRHIFALGAFVVWSMLIFVAASLLYSPTGYIDLVKAAYGLPCQGKEDCSGEIENQYTALLPMLAEGDIVASTNPHVTNYYLGRIESVLRQYKITGGFTTFENTNAYLGINYIDSIDKLREVRNSDRRVWIITDRKLFLHTSQEFRDLLNETYSKYDETALLTIYVNNP